MFEEITLKNINAADALSLADLPGIGPSLAELIVENQPYATLEDLLDVKGIGPQSLVKLRGLITVEETGDENEDLAEEDPLAQLDSAEETLAAEDISPQEEIAPFDIFEGEGVAEVLEEIEEEKESIVEKEIVKKKGDNLITRSQARWLSFSSALLAFILALALTLGVLTSINSGLRYASQSQSATIERQVSALDAQIDTLAQDIEGLRERVANLDHLGNRVDKFEDRLIVSEREIENLSQQLNELQESSGRFQAFLEDLRQLLNNLFQSEEIQ